MNRLAILTILAAGALAACSGGGGQRPAVVVPADRVETARPDDGPADPGAPAVRARKLDADATIELGGGATFTASAGWTVEEHPDGVRLIAPEGDVTMVLMAVEAPTRAEAFVAAWARWRPGFDLAAAQDVDLPARDGWDAVGQTVYVTPAAEQRLVAAVGARKGGTWYVTLLDGSMAGYGRRNAQIGTVLESLTVPGLDKESFAGKAAHALDTARLAELEAFIEEARAAVGVPGVAVAIVQGGKVVYEKGFGVRERGKAAKVGPQTLFMVGSVGKSLTTLMIARMVEAGRLAWDTPVVQALPAFALGDAATTQAVTMRHTACACTGMPRQDLEFIFEGAVTPEARLASMAAMRPTTGFGETFQYSNLMVSAGGFAAAHVYAPKQQLGPAYDAAMKALVFDPLGMKASTFDFAKVAKADHAVPHSTDLHGARHPQPITAETWVRPVRPAGGAWSNVRDMARVLLLELGRGALGGKQVVDEAQLVARRAPQVKMTDELSYGLGLVVGTVHGIPVVTHGGATGGFASQFTFLPDHDVGIVILTNASGGGLFNGAIERRLLELLFDGRELARDDLATALARIEAGRAEALARIELEPDAAWFDALAGAWEAPGLGRIELRRDKGKPVLDAGEWKVPVGRRTALDGTVTLVTTGGLIVGLDLEPREQDGRTVLVLDAGQQVYVFERAAPAKGKAKGKGA